MNRSRTLLISSCLAVVIAVLVGPALSVRLSSPREQGDYGAFPIQVAWEDSIVNAGNDNETNCHRYDDNDNQGPDPNLIKKLLNKFCQVDKRAREYDEQAGGSVEGQANVFAGTTVQVASSASNLAPAGKETAITFRGEHVVLRVFPNLGQDVTVSIRSVDPATIPAPSGTLVSAFAFEIQATGTGGATLSSLPAEARLSTVYTDAELGSLDESKLSLARLDPATKAWTDAPKQAADAKSNYVSATITALGTYILYQR